MRQLRFKSFYSSLKQLNANNLKFELTQNSKSIPKKEELVFGRTFTDHMLSVQWDNSVGWHNPIIHPYSKLHLYPSSVVFHYAFSCFEGLKAYLSTKNDEIRLFRPDMNMNRLNKSCERLSLPTFDSNELIKLIGELIKIDREWIPQGKGYSMYIRPAVIGTEESVAVTPVNKALLFVLLSPVGPYYSSGFKAISLIANEKHVRSWPGGTGSYKISGNYAPGIMPQREALKKGYHQILWLFGKEDYVTEVGTMNLFIYWINKKGEEELITPPLTKGLILPGITRDSILSLTKQINRFKVSERDITMKEIVDACQQNRMKEMFGTGTACIISPIKSILYKNEVINIPLNTKNPASEAGPLVQELFRRILKIQCGEIESDWSVVIK